MVEILGPDGKPIPDSLGPVRKDQTARLGHLHREIAEHPTRGLTPAKLAAIYRRAEEGDLVAQAQMAMDMEEKDAHLFAELSKRRLAVQAVDWHIEAPPDPTPAEESATQLCRDVLAELDLGDLIYDLTDAILHSYAACEYHWRLVDGVNVPTQPVYRQPDWFQADYHGHDFNRLLLRDHTGRGEPLKPLNWLLHIQKSRSGYLTRSGLVRVLGWPFLMRALSTRDLAEFLEIYGLPLRLGKYPNNATDTEKATLLRAVVGIGHAAAGIIPEGMQIEFKEAAQAGAGANPFMAMMQWAEGAISKAILGGTLTTSAESTGLGSNLGETHNEVRKEIAASDRRQLAKTLEQHLLRPIVALNTSAERAPRWVWDDEEAADLKEMADALPGLVDGGMQIPLEWAHGRLKIPLPKEGETVLTRPQAADPFAGLAQGLAANNQRPGRPSADAVPKQLARLQREGDALVEGWVEQIRALVQQADSFQDLQRRLDEAFPDLDGDALADLLGDAMAAAHLAGRYDIIEGF